MTLKTLRDFYILWIRDARDTVLKPYVGFAKNLRAGQAIITKIN